GGQADDEEEVHHGGDEIGVGHFPGAAVMSVFFRHGLMRLRDAYLPMPLSICSSSSALGLTSLLRPRRATSTAMTGAMPLAKPMTEEAMQRANPISASPLNSMHTASGLRKP